MQIKREGKDYKEQMEIKSQINCWPASPGEVQRTHMLVEGSESGGGGGGLRGVGIAIRSHSKPSSISVLTFLHPFILSILISSN